jgi:hypothetical protein
MNKMVALALLLNVVLFFGFTGLFLYTTVDILQGNINWTRGIVAVLALILADQTLVYFERVAGLPSAHDLRRISLVRSMLPNPQQLPHQDCTFCQPMTTPTEKKGPIGFSMPNNVNNAPSVTIDANIPEADLAVMKDNVLKAEHRITECIDWLKDAAKDKDLDAPGFTLIDQLSRELEYLQLLKSKLD